MKEERQAFYDVTGEFNAARCLAAGVLFVPVAASAARRAASPSEVDENIRGAHFYLEVLPAGSPVAEASPVERSHGYRLALECCADSALPMCETAILRQEELATPDEFRNRLRDHLAHWLERILNDISTDISNEATQGANQAAHG